MYDSLLFRICPICCQNIEIDIELISIITDIIGVTTIDYLDIETNEYKRMYKNMDGVFFTINEN